MIIRPMRPEDERAVRALSDAIYDGDMDRPEGFHRDNPTIVATYEGAVVGFGSYRIVDWLMILLESAVDPEYRGCGLGRRLLQERIDIAKRLGLVCVTSLRDNNTPEMVHLLPSLGFVPRERYGTEVLHYLEP